MTLALSACSGAVVQHPAPTSLLSADTSAPTDYVIGAGDEVELKFYYNPELNDRLVVRPDGKVSVPFVQDVQAAGRTPTALRDEIRTLMTPHLRQPEAVVTVRSFASQRVFVGGEVNRPGPVQLNGRMSILQTLAEAGWVRDTARKDEVVLVRRDQQGGRNIFAVDLDRALNGEDMSQDVVLKPEDMVFVPPSGVANAARWVDQHIRQMLFFTTNVGFSVTRDIGPNKNN